MKKVITAITFQWQYNTKFLAERNQPKIYGERTIRDLEKELTQGVKSLQSIYSFVSMINYLIDKGEEVDIPFQMKVCLGSSAIPQITEKTKKKRTYSCMGLTIHEEDRLTDES